SNLGKITRLFSGWGMRIFDYDNDGHKDLFLANSHMMDNIELTQPHLSYRQKPLLLRNAGNTFVNVSAGSGEIFNQLWASRGAAFGDLDNDGDIDIVVSNCNDRAYCLRNDGGNSNHWLALELRGTQSNRDGIGAQVRLTNSSGKIQWNMVSTAASYLSANDRRVYFGLGSEPSVKEIRIQWPSGTQQVIVAPKPDQILKVDESSPTTGSVVSRAANKLSKASPPAKPSNAGQSPPRGTSPPSAAQLSSGSQGPSPAGKTPAVNPVAVVKYQLAESLLQQGKAVEAAEALNAAIQLQPDFIEAHFALGVILARQGRESYGTAIDHFLAVLRLDPRHLDARINLSNLLEEGGDFEAAASALKEALSLADGRADLYVMLAQKQAGAEKYSEAIQSFHRALELDPQVPGAHYGLAMTLRSLGDLTAAQSEFELALKLNPNDALAHYQLGRFLIQLKEPVEAARHLEESIRLKPELADAYSKLGVLYRSLKKNDEAEKAFRAAVRLNPKLEKACYGLAQLLQAKGERAEAERFFEQVRQLKA